LDAINDFNDMTTLIKELSLIENKYLTRFGVKFFNPKAIYVTFKNMNLLNL
jgi:hypothetical protein